jgi:predicted O-methyltransferase YrrM
MTSPQDRLNWVGDRRLLVDDTAFTFLRPGIDTEEPGLFLCKEPGQTVDYATMLAEFTDANIVELGIHKGGSAALLALLARPRRLVALDIEPTPAEALTEFIDAGGHGDRVHAHYGIDQADRTTLAAIVDREFGVEPIDLVIDDASHLLDPTRASFETLFPRVRPGGLYCIEDWRWQHQMSDGISARLHRPEERETFAARLRSEVDVAGSAIQDAFARRIPDVLAEPGSPGRDAFAHRLAELIAEPGSEARVAFEQRLAEESKRPDPEMAARAGTVRALLEDPSIEGEPLVAEIEAYLLALDEPAAPPDPDPRPPAGGPNPTAPPSGALVSLVLELVLLRAHSDDIITSVEVGDTWVRVRRGPAELDPGSFRVADHAIDRFGLLSR